MSYKSKIPDHGFYALSVSYLQSKVSVNNYTSGGMAGDAANEFHEKHESFFGEFVVIRTIDLFSYYVPENKPYCVKNPLHASLR